MSVQNDTPSRQGDAIRRLAAAAPTLALAALMLALVAPRGTPGLLALLALPMVTLAALRGDLVRSTQLKPVEWAVLGLGCYIAVNASWSVDHREAYEKVAIYFLFAALVSLAATALPTLGDETAAGLRRALLIAVATGAIFLAIETNFGQPIKRLIVSMLPFIRPPAKHMDVENGWVTHIQPYVLNRNHAILSLLLWPALLGLRGTLKSPMAWAAMAALTAVSAIAIFPSEHETSMIALMAALLVFGGMWLWPSAVRVLVVAGWVAATMLIVPIASASYSAKLYQAQWIPLTGRNRIVLWGVTSKRVWKAPILGVGLTSTKPLDQEAADKAAWPKDHPYPLRTGRHSHNIYMQTWYELGAIGALLLLAIGLGVLRLIWRLAPDVQPYAFASFVSASIIGAFSWGMWQPWFMAAFGFWAVALMIVVDAAERQQKGRAG